MAFSLQFDTGHDQIRQAVARIQTELGWPPRAAHNALAEYAAAYGVLRRDVAAAILAANSLKRGLGYVMSDIDFDRV